MSHIILARGEGAISRLTRAQAEAAAASGATPLQLLLAISRRDVVALREMRFPVQAVTPALRVRAAESASPYVHRRQPQGIDGGSDGSPVNVTVVPSAKLASMTDEQLRLLVYTLSQVAPDHPAARQLEQFRLRQAATDAVDV